LPSAGVPAEPGQICSVGVEPVESGLAAHVTLEKLGGADDLSQATGLCVIDAALEPRVIGEPVIEVIDASHSALLQMSVSGLTKVAGGWSFSASFPAPLELQADGWARMTVRTAFELDCAPEPTTRVVHAATDVHVCLENGQVEWASSGESCTVCRIIAEMAPSPIVPEPTPDDLPLARALRLRIVELARVSNTVVLWAENDGGDDLEYEWHASGGQVQRLSPDVVAWTLQEGMPAPFIQVAISGPDALAVSSFGFNEAA
jgi:hypothetical protein